MDISAVLDKLGFDWRLALANLVNFLIVFWLLKRFVWIKMRSLIEERQNKIEKGLADAEEAETAVREARAESDKVLDEAKKERSALLQGAHEDAKLVAAKAAKDAQEKADKLAQDAEKRAKEIEENALRKVQENSADLIVSAARAVLRDGIDEKRGEEIIRTMLKKS